MLIVIIYNNEFILKNKLSASYQNQIVNAIKLYFKTIRETKIKIEKIHRPKRGNVLPNVLTKEEVKLILEAQSNVKPKMMLILIYSCGLRCGELIALQLVPIDSKRNIVLLKNSKGKRTALFL
jgi:integrase/recombinase XerD